MITRYVHSEVNENPYCFYFALDSKTGVMRIKFEQHLQWPRDVRVGWIKQRPHYHVVDARYQRDMQSLDLPHVRALTAEEETTIMTAFDKVKHEVAAIRKELKNETNA